MLTATDNTEIYLGRFVKAFGIKGELKLLASDDFWEAVLESQELTLQWLEDGDVIRRPVRFERARRQGGVWIVKVEGIDDRNAAEDEVEAELFIDTDNLDVDLPDHELPFQIVGFTVKTEDGEIVGEIRSVIFSAAHNVYEVAGAEGVVLIPAIPEFVVGRDAERREVVIRPIPGLIDG